MRILPIAVTFILIFADVAGNTAVLLLGQEPTGISFRSSPNEQIIRKVLTQTVTFPAHETCDSLAQKLSEQLGINVIVDRTALEGSGVASDTPISPRISKAVLATGLDLLLRDLRLTWIIRNDALVLTTNEEEENSLDTRVYPVSDLVTFDEQGRLVEDFEPLIDAIKSVTGVPKPGWIEDGGVGTVKGFPGGRLVCSQTSHVHDEIEGLLAALRVTANGSVARRLYAQRAALATNPDESMPDALAIRRLTPRHARRYYSNNPTPHDLTPLVDRGND